MELAAEYGSDPDAAWAVSGSGEVEKLHAFRHAAPETCNLFIEEARQKDPRITKLGTDMQTKGSGLWEQVSGYRKDLEAGVWDRAYGAWGRQAEKPDLQGLSGRSLPGREPKAERCLRSRGTIEPGKPFYG